MKNISKNKQINNSLKKDTKNRAIALTCFISLNILAIFSDSIIAQFKNSEIENNIITKKTKPQNQIIEVEHLEYSAVKELIELQKKYQKLESKYDNLDDKISKLQNQQNSSHIILSYFDLIKKIENNQNYQNQLILTKSLINKESILYQNFLELEKILKSKIKNCQKIQNDFDNIIGKIISYNRINDSDDLTDKIKNNILNQIIIRKIKFEKEEETNLDYIIHKIESNIKSQNYQIALNYLNKIKHIPEKSLSDLKIDLEKLIKFQKINQKIIKLLS
jgi:hypothetical protein